MIYITLCVSTHQLRLSNGSYLFPSCTLLQQNAEGKVLREPPLDTQRRSAEAKDDDPIIPFGPLPTVSPFGAISRTSKTGYQTTGPVQAMASSQVSGSKHMTGDWRSL